MRLYYSKNKDKILAARKTHYFNNKDTISKKGQEYHKRTYVPIPKELRKKRGAVRADGMRSGFERTLANQMNLVGVKFEYETLPLKYTLEGTYWPDFILPNGIIIEAKGLLDDQSKRKMIAVKKQYPDLDIRFCFMVADKKIPGMKSTHGQWADRNGFKWSDGTIPQEWLDEE